MEFRLLGQLSVVDDEGRDVPLGGRKQRSVLALLLLEAGRPVAADRLVDGVWGERAHARASATLQVYVSTLRRLLVDGAGHTRLVPARPGYRLDAEPAEVDALRFRRLLEKARADRAGGRDEAASAALREALGQWRGPALGDLGAEPFAAPHVTRLEELRLEAWEDLAESELRCGRPEGLVAELERLLAEHALRERLWAALMTALYRCGRQADALRAYARARATFAEELGLDPGPSLRALERRVLDQDPGLEVQSPGNRVRLPHPPGALIGRAREVADLAELLTGSATRLVTVTGSGGAGKTRLAIAAAAAAAGHFPGGVFFVPLDAVEDPGLVLSSIAQVLDLPEAAGVPRVIAIATAVAGRPVLLVLDNLEQVLGAAGELAELLASAPGLRLLVTSRALLRLRGEREYAVPPLEVPDRSDLPALDVLASTSAVALFVERASAVAPAFRLGDDNASAVAEICARLGGLPLALELAAARVRVLSPEDMLARLVHPLALLTGGAGDLPERQRTLRATLAWSWRLLPPAEQVLLRRLGVFAGSMTLEAAHRVAGTTEQAASSPEEVLESLTVLVDHGMVRAVPAGSQMRFDLPETVREYAGELLLDSGEDAEVRARHSAYVLDAAVEAAADLAGAAAGRRLAVLSLDLPDVRTALQWALDHGGIPAAAAAAVALVRFWRAKGPLDEARRWLELVLGSPGLPAELDVDVRVAAAAVRYSLDDYGRSGELLASAVERAEVLGDDGRLAVALGWLSHLELARGELPSAAAAANRALALARAVADDEALHRSLYAAAYVAYASGDAEAAGELTGEDLALSRRRGDLISVADCLTNLAVLAVDDGRYDEAYLYVGEAVALARQIAARTSLRNALQSHGTAALALGLRAVAEGSFTAALEHSRALGERFEAAEALVGLAGVAVSDGNAVRGAILYGAAASMFEGIGAIDPPLGRELKRYRAAAEAQLGAAFDEAFTRGRRLERSGALPAVLATGG